MGLKKKILENIEYQLDKGTLNDKDICAEYKIMKKLIEEKNG